tara:strand:+ start:464 stop:688 length:225 start_codon:yes stop_codon:yes gene_type:complete
MTDVKKEIIEVILSNPSAQKAVASSATALPIINTIMDWAPSVITIVGGLLGMVLTAMMIVHKRIQIRNDLKNGL